MLILSICSFSLLKTISIDKFYFQLRCLFHFFLHPVVLEFSKLNGLAPLILFDSTCVWGDATKPDLLTRGYGGMRSYPAHCQYLLIGNENEVPQVQNKVEQVFITIGGLIRQYFTVVPVVTVPKSIQTKKNNNKNDLQVVSLQCVVLWLFTGCQG